MVHNSLPRMWWLAKGQKRSQHYNPGDIDTLNKMDYYWNFFLAFKHSLNVNLVYTWISFQVTSQVDCVWNRNFLFLTRPTAFLYKTRFCAFVAWKWICMSAYIFFALGTQTYLRGSSTKNIAFHGVLHNVGGSNTPWIGHSPCNRCACSETTFLRLE